MSFGVVSVEILEAAEADAVHPFEVELDAFFGDVAVHPVPPNSRLGRIGRTLESFFQRRRRILRGTRCRQG
jgi:hypothetical protein